MDLTGGEIQFLMTLGLVWIQDLLKLSSCEDLYRALRVDKMPPSCSTGFWSNFFVDHVYEEDYDGKISDQLINSKPRLQDEDDGPEMIWRLALAESWPALYDYANWEYRRWGFVFWDLERL